MLKLYDFWRSSAAYRARIALNLKGLPYDLAPTDLAAGAQRRPEYLAENPQGFVPALLTDDGLLTQSAAIIEWLEKTHPEPALLPADAVGRAKVRAIVAAVACDIHPINNLRVLNHLRAEFGLDDAGVQRWALRWIEEGFGAIETLLADGPGGPWAWGAAPTMADVFLIPQIYSGVSRFGLDISRYPRLALVEGTAGLNAAFVAAHPDRQPR